MTRAPKEKLTIITTHMNADLDGLSSMLGASILYPEALLVIPDTCEPAVRFVLQHPLLAIVRVHTWSEISLDAVNTVILVDTADPERIGPYGQVLLKRDVRWIAYDTHPPDTNQETEYPMIESHHAPYGATTTLIVEQIMAKKITLTRTQATLLALGIYEDTGMFTFVGTVSADFRAAAFLFDQGADVRIIRDILQIHLNELQVSCLNELREKVEPLPLKNVKVYFSGIRRDRYIPDLALVVHRLMDELPVEVLFVALEIPGHVYLIGRSRSQAVNVGDILGQLGGGGHAYAGSASLKGKTLIEVKEALIRHLEKALPKPPRARDIMTRPVRTIHYRSTIQHASDMLNQLRVNALPVSRDGQIVGLITRQIADQALRMGLEDRFVEEMMEPAPPVVHPDASPDEIARAMIEHRTRIVLVGTDNRHVEGIVTRMDLIRARYDVTTNGTVTLARPVPHPPNYWRRIEKLCETRIWEYLKIIGEIAEAYHMSAYLVGGTTRDIVMERTPLDYDIVVEGNAIPIAKEFAERFSARIHSYQRYGTAVVIFPDGQRLDFATARTETYLSPGAPPKVEVGTMLRQDLYRRDFTINAMAIALNPDRRGNLVDFYGGLRDIHDGIIRVLHALSFFEDPARILRAVRFAGRYGFHLSAETDHLLRQALQAKVIKHLPSVRLGTEMRYLLQEDAFNEIVRLMIEYQIFQSIHPRWKWRRQDLPDFQPYIEALDWYRVTHGREPEIEWVYRALVLFRNLPRAIRTELAERFGWPKDVIDQLKDFREAIRNLMFFYRRHAGSITPGEILVRVRSWPLTWVLFGLAYYHEPLKQTIRFYLSRGMKIRPPITGNDLIRLGLKPGPQFRKILDEIWIATINGDIKDRKSALKWLEQRYELRHTT